jgi:hypothetical protein
MNDYLQASPPPRFDDKQFERFFRVRRCMVDNIINNLAGYDTFWTQTRDACGELSIHPYVKFLAAQKIICYGVSPSAFQDYFQMGESTARLCVHHLCRGIVECPEIANVYLRNPSRADAKRVADMHKEVHGIDGMLGSLDVTKVVWENCPAALKGQFQGKEKVATIGLEAVADHNLWIWHSAFGFPGSLNDINIWERSPLFESMQNGQHDELDFPFTADGLTFDKLFYLVDGIYPRLVRFLATICDPKSIIASYFAKKQEAARKDVERAFGVMKIKFLCLKHPILLHNNDDIFYVVLACVAMHNMMVEWRVDEGNDESSGFYAVSDEDVTAEATGVTGEANGNTAVGGDEHSSNGHRAQEHEPSLDESNDDGTYNCGNICDAVEKTAMVRKRWEELYNADGAKRLQTAIMNQLFKDNHSLEEFEASDRMLDDFNPLVF